MPINQINAGNTFQQWLSTTQQLVNSYNNFENDINTINSNKDIIFDTANNTVNVYNNTVNTYNDTVNTYNDIVDYVSTSAEMANISYDTANAALIVANNANNLATQALNSLDTLPFDILETANLAVSMSSNNANDIIKLTANTTNSISFLSNTTNSAYLTANSAYLTANGAYSTANSAYLTANGAYSTGNAAYARANSAQSTANSAYYIANGAFSTANAAYNVANTITQTILNLQNSTTSPVERSILLANVSTGPVNTLHSSALSWNASNNTLTLGGTKIRSNPSNTEIFNTLKVPGLLVGTSTLLTTANINLDVQGYNTTTQNLINYYSGTGNTGIMEKFSNGTFGRIAITTSGKSLMTAASAYDQRTALGLGTMAVENKSGYVPMVSDTISNIIINETCSLGSIKNIRSSSTHNLNGSTTVLAIETTWGSIIDVDIVSVSEIMAFTIRVPLESDITSRTYTLYVKNTTSYTHTMSFTDTVSPPATTYVKYTGGVSSVSLESGKTTLVTIRTRSNLILVTQGATY